MNQSLESSSPRVKSRKATPKKCDLGKKTAKSANRSAKKVAASLKLDSHLLTIKNQIGELAWQDRIKDALERQAGLKRAAEVLSLGGTIAAAAKAFGGSAGIFKRWQEQYECDGLKGLITRNGREKFHSDEQVIEFRKPIKAGRPSTSFIKWAGSKRSVMPALMRLVPDNYGTYYEPMLGSGSLFFTLNPKCAVLSDTNVELIACFEVVRDKAEGLIKALLRHENSYAHFISVRSQNFKKLSPLQAAARFIYLNKTCFNGLYRVNKHGHFNVPYGRKTNAQICDAKTLRKMSCKLQGVTLKCCDYRQALKKARRNDLVYLDPPYFKPSTYGTFRYQQSEFGFAEHVELAEMFRDLDRRGCHVILSNSNYPEVFDLYRGFHIEVLKTHRTINAKGKRTGFSELVVCNTKPRIA